MDNEELIETMSEYYDDDGELAEIKINTKVFSDITVKEEYVIFRRVK